jgi:CheY-like chemotaxis protein
MDRETQERVFEPFFTTKEPGKGTGLGLAMVYGTIKQHNGFITVASEPGKGSAFSVYLPLADEGARLHEESLRPVVSSGNETILLVEDDASVRKVTRALLESLGYRVLEAEDGEGAVALFRAHHGDIELVLSDVIMPKMSGKDLRDALKGIHPGVRVLFISGYTADILLQKGIRDEEFDFVSKPLRPDVLSRKIREVLRRSAE